jgi:hypothetical protein
MPSNAYHHHLEDLLADARSLMRGHRFIREAGAMAHAERSAFPRAAVVACLSAWESFIEELMREAAAALRPPTPPLGAWPALNAHVHGLVSAFHTPNAGNSDRLVEGCIGLAEVHLSWRWQNTTPVQAVQRLADALADRHRIAHGVDPRPAIPAAFAEDLDRFILRLARRTDDAVRQHLVAAHGLADPWPA